nr:histidine phosphatase family protein [Acetobacter estunensis]
MRRKVGQGPFCVLARHPAVRVAAGTCYGQTDVPLAEGWESFAARLAGELAVTGAQRMFVSPLTRCRLPAEWIAAQGIVRVFPDDRLMELDFGEWEGQPWSLVPREKLDEWAGDLAGFTPPGGESGNSLIARVTEFWRERLPDGPIAILSHGGPLRVLTALAQGQKPDLTQPAPPLGDIVTFGRMSPQAPAIQPVPTEPPSRPEDRR